MDSKFVLKIPIFDLNKYSKSFDYVPLSLPSRDLPVTVFGPTLPTVTDRYWSLTNFTVTWVTSVTDRNIVCFEQIFKVLLKKLL